jgi:SsrA-binding protein
MAAKSKKSNKKSAGTAVHADQSRTIAENRKARHRYEIIEQLECGIVLVGSEVKSLRNGKISLDEAYVRFQNDALWLIGANIAAYTQASIWNHEFKRPRKLLVRRRQLDALQQYAFQKGLTLVPLRVYFNSRGLVKLIVGVCRGKKLHDKRETMKKADVKRDIDREMRKRR